MNLNIIKTKTNWKNLQFHQYVLEVYEIVYPSLYSRYMLSYRMNLSQFYRWKKKNKIFIRKKKYLIIEHTRKDCWKQ